jgi:hypothetical protein
LNDEGGEYNFFTAYDGLMRMEKYKYSKKTRYSKREEILTLCLKNNYDTD